MQDLRVLIADDDDDLREKLVVLLGRRGCLTREARNGAEVLDWLRASRDLAVAPPDVLLLDVRMPRFTGVDLVAQLRRAGWHLPIVLMTALVDDEVRDAAVVWGAAAVLEKPFSSDTLETVLLNVTWLSERARSGPSMPLNRAERSGRWPSADATWPSALERWPKLDEERVG
ncbi:MAG TPA: response regulator [Polyangiaceae bacterium]|jgi:CheY-like chemotaxis protein